MTMKTFKDVKARFVVGAEITATNYKIATASGRRRIEKVQTNGYWFTQLDEAPGVAESIPVGATKPLPSRIGKRAWYAFPSAKQCRIDGPDCVTFLEADGTALVSITFSKGA